MSQKNFLYLVNRQRKMRVTNL